MVPDYMRGCHIILHERMSSYMRRCHIDRWMENLFLSEKEFSQFWSNTSDFWKEDFITILMRFYSQAQHVSSQ